MDFSPRRLPAPPRLPTCAKSLLVPAAAALGKGSPRDSTVLPPPLPPPRSVARGRARARAVVLALGCAITLFMTLAISSSQHGKTDRVATTVRDVVAARDR